MSLATVPLPLLLRCKSGDRNAFERLYRLIETDLYRITFSFMRNHDDTDDVLQESLIRMYRYFGSLKKVEKFSSWAMRIIVNQCHTHRSRKGRHAYTPIDEMGEREDPDVMFHNGVAANPREDLIRKELLSSIHQAIGELPKRQRMAILLFEIQGLSIKETAEAMQCSEGAVKFNIHQARRKLQKALHAEKNSFLTQTPPQSDNEDGQACTSQQG